MAGRKPQRIRQRTEQFPRRHNAQQRHQAKQIPVPSSTSSTAKISTLSGHYSDIPQLTLNVEKSRITDVTVQEGTHAFAFWFIVSSYLPVLSACLCPLTNMISIAALVTKWRQNADGVYIKDTKLVYILNSISLGLGCIGNVSIVLNFGRRLPYKISQSISITSFFAASFVLFSAVLIAGTSEFEDYEQTEGYWFAIITTVLYFGCGLLSFLNFAGTLLKKYPPDYNLTTPERGLIVYNFTLAVWFVWGAALFSNLNDLSYGDAMYYCTVSLLTIGLGDIVPQSNVSKGLTLAYSLTGIIILGLIIAMIRSMMTSTTSPVLFWNSVEMRRKSVLDRVTAEKLTLSHEASFDLMRSIRKEARNRQRNINTMITIFIFVIFWLIGAVVFHFAEHWAYFNAVYFCFLCLLTIGYGDYVPKSAAGRPIFIVWALSAVPLMTVLISNLGDSMFHSAMKGVYLIEKLKIFTKRFKTLYEEEAEIMSDADIDDQETRSVNEIIEEAENEDANHPNSTNKKAIFDNLLDLITESKTNPNKRYSYEQWKNIINLLELEDDDIKQLGIDSNVFWISDQSPLRFPISEPNYLLFLLFSKMEALITDEAANLMRERTNITTPSLS